MTTKQILRIMNILVWVVFIGSCIQTGAILYSFFVSLFINQEGSKNLYMGLNLSELYNYSIRQYVTMVLYIICLSALKAFIAYLVIKIFLKINFVHPFSTTVTALITKIGYVASGIGILALIGTAYSEWLIKRGVRLPPLHYYLGDAAVFLFFGGIIFIIALVFKRGIEIQSENELTV